MKIQVMCDGISDATIEFLLTKGIEWELNAGIGMLEFDFQTIDELHDLLREASKIEGKIVHASLTFLDDEKDPSKNPMMTGTINTKNPFFGNE